MGTEVGLPGHDQLSKILGLLCAPDADVGDLLDRSLLEPLRDFLGRPSKRLRAGLVEVGFRFARRSMALDADELALCAQGAAILESLHAGSLVVDDIQDASEERRGRPTLHRSHGVPIALNAGNWLYFWPLEQLRSRGLDPTRELNVYRLCHEALLRAHFGQALDVGTGIDEIEQSRVCGVCLASLELKSGALTALAMGLGGALGGADEKLLDSLKRFGNRFGVALQMFDDIGNLKAKVSADGKLDPKQYEDLRLRRPSWIWAVASLELSADDYASFGDAARNLPDRAPIERWLHSHSLTEAARRRANESLSFALDELSRDTGEGIAEVDGMRTLRALAEQLRRAYE